jgi:hypothetical protein
MADDREHDKADGSERENRRDRIRCILIVRLNRPLGGDDRGHAANRRADREEARQLRPQVERAAERRHDGDRCRELHDHAREAHASESRDVAQHEPDAQQHDPAFQPELIRLDAGLADRRHADRIRDDEPENDRPQHVLDVRQRQQMGLAVCGDRLLGELAGVADRAEDDHAGDETQHPASG